MKTLGNRTSRSRGLTLPSLIGLIVVVATGEPLAVGQSQERTASWTLTGNMNTPRHAHTAVLLPNGKVLVAGGAVSGAGPTHILSSAELYDPATGSWRATGNLHLPRYLCSATLLANGKVMIAGGYTGTAPSFGPTNTTELYDPVTETWSFSGNLSTPRAWHAATLVSGQVLVIGGWLNTSSVTLAESYDVETGTWTPTRQPITPRYGPTATLLQDGRILVAGGSDDGDLASTLADVELYDSTLQLWKITDRLGTDRIFHTATPLPSGMVLIAGGYTWPPGSFASAELYDPTTEKWSYTRNLRWARESHTALLLPNGKVLVAGGYDWSCRVFLDCTELYDPPTATWSDTANLNTARSKFTATLLPDGKVLVAGGTGGGNPERTLNGAELYDSGAVAGMGGMSGQVGGSRISNLAIRALGGGDTPLIAGFTVGPSLATLGVENTVTDPKLVVIAANGGRVAENNGFSATVDETPIR